LRVLIAGGGIAGLALAALLRQRGIAPDIVEAAATHDHQSYVLGLYPFGARVLHGLGVHRSFTAVSEACQRRERSAPSSRAAICSGCSNARATTNACAWEPA
jgi:2-polyprenyl-6-methoxyphenol hydroxylase-like FAD-dependent oxidoreductase